MTDAAASETSRYRADIDGLRAVAVVPVVFFHAHTPFISGGYVGVDVFFVISGFLITSMIAAEIRDGRFSIVRFYERRVRRIFPAFFAVIAAASIAATILLTPSALRDFALSVFSAAAFGSNLLFFWQADYFDAPAHMKPLLHTWSLAVEEQFYLAFPWVLVAVHRWWRTRTLPVVVVTMLASLLAGIWMTSHNAVVGRQLGASAAFYLLPFRAWELLMGSALALGMPAPLKRSVAHDVGAAAGLALIGWAVLSFDDQTTFPGALALVPCLGALLILMTGSHSGVPTIVGRLLAARPVVFVGKISYSLYLWHWPLLILAASAVPRPLTGWETALVVAASFVFAVLSWRFVEQPIRARAVLRSRFGLFAAAAVASGAAIAFALLAITTNGLPSRMSEAVVQLDHARLDSSKERERCLSKDTRVIPFAEQCLFGELSARPMPAAAIWGDSFAAELAVALGDEAARRHQAILSIAYSACPPVLGLFAEDTPCERHNRAVITSFTERPDIRTVVLVARYDAYVTALGVQSLAAFERVVDVLRRAGKEVVLVFPVPRPPAHVPTVLARVAAMGRDPHEVVMARSQYQHEYAEVLGFLERLVVEKGARAARIQDVLCSSESCRLMAGDDVLYFDANHLSVAGARQVMPAFAAVFEPAP